MRKGIDGKIKCKALFVWVDRECVCDSFLNFLKILFLVVDPHHMRHHSPTQIISHFNFSFSIVDLIAFIFVSCKARDGNVFMQEFAVSTSSVDFSASPFPWLKFPNGSINHIYVNLYEYHDPRYFPLRACVCLSLSRFCYLKISKCVRTTLSASNVNEYVASPIVESLCTTRRLLSCIFMVTENAVSRQYHVS